MAVAGAGLWPYLPNPGLHYTQGGAKVLVYSCEDAKHSLFFYYYVLIIAFFPYEQLETNYAPPHIYNYHQIRTLISTVNQLSKRYTFHLKPTHTLLKVVPHCGT